MAARVSIDLAGRIRLLVLFVFGLSALGFALQVLLTRLFSVIFQYHFVFLIVSVAIAGLSAGAALAAVLQRRHRQETPEQTQLALVYGALLLSAALLLLLLVLALVQSANLTAILLLAALLPYVVIGYINGRIFSEFASASGLLYAADLLGGAFGLVAALAITGALGAFMSVGLLASASMLIAFLPAWIARQRRMQRVILAGGVLLLSGMVLNIELSLLDFSPAQFANSAPDKTMMRVLQDTEARLIETRWDPFARLDVVVPVNDRLRYVFTDAGAGSIMIPYTGDAEAVAWLRQGIEYLPFAFETETIGKVLVIGAGAGQDVLLARLAGAEAITAVEINPTLVDLTRDYAGYNGSVYDLPGVETVITDGRHYAERSSTAYDLIYANVVYSQAAGPGHSALAESYIFTQEALHTYWSRLSETGRIGFVTHHGIEGLRLVVAALDMLQREGLTLQQALRHVALVSLRSGDPQARTSVVMINRNPWTAAQANTFADAAHQRGAGALYLPEYMEVGLEPMIQGAITLDDYIAANADFNFTPATDDRPFFYQFRPGLPAELSDLLLVSSIVSFAYLSWLVFFFVRRDAQHWKRASLAPYFALLGAAFLMVETPLIQRFGLMVGQPVLALVAVLIGLLAGGGLGSFFSSRFPVEALPHRTRLFAAGAGAAILLSLIVYPQIIEHTIKLDLPVRAGVTVLSVLPLGFLMGVPFPSGLRMAYAADPQGIAAFWGANAATSVFGAALAMALAISVGFSAALIVGAAMYLTAAAIIHLTWPRMLVSL